MSASDRDPLSLEERALADRLQRLGGPEGPPAALDARILGAARAAAAPVLRARARRGPRMFAWLPAGAVTAIGTAAAFVVAIGAVWQLRPVDRPAVQAPAAADDGVVSVELLGPRERPQAVDATAGTRARADAPVASTSSVATEETASTRDAVRAAAPMSTADASPPRATQSTVAAAPSTATVDAARPEPAPTTPSAMAEPELAARPARPAAEETAEPRRQRRATYTTAARARGEAPEDRPVRAAPRDQETRALLDVAAIPIEEDATLAPAEWLERVRARRDAGDIDGAQRSLRRFGRAYPRLRLPRDLDDLAR